MSTGEVKKVSSQDLQLVQNLIERCLQLYMSQKEVVSTLLHQAKIEPSFTELVWQKLEEENQDFFKAYHMRLILKDQIMKFNKLLETQAELMHQISPAAGAASVPISNGSHVPLYHTGQPVQPENMHQPTVAKMPSALTNGGSSIHPSMPSGVGTNIVMAQNPNMGLMQGMIKPQSSYSGDPSFQYGPTGNGHPAIQEVPVSSFIGEESNPKPVNEPVIDAETQSYGFLSQIPRNFSLSDLTADFSISSGILDNYSRSPFLETETNFLNPHGNRDVQGRYSTRADKSFGK